MILRVVSGDILQLSRVYRSNLVSFVPICVTFPGYLGLATQAFCLLGLVVGNRFKISIRLEMPWVLDGLGCNMVPENRG